MRANAIFANALARLREHRGWSKSDLARAADVTPTCVWNWEMGHTHPRAGAMDRIANAFGVAVSDLEAGLTGGPVVRASGSSSTAVLRDKARSLTGLDGEELEQAVFTALIGREGALRLAALGGPEIDLHHIPRRRQE